MRLYSIGMAFCPQMISLEVHSRLKSEKVQFREAILFASNAKINVFDIISNALFIPLLAHCEMIMVHTQHTRGIIKKPRLFEISKFLAQS